MTTFIVLLLSAVFVLLLIDLFRRPRVNLKPETQALLDAAFEAKAEAVSQDEDVVAASEALAIASQQLGKAEADLAREKDEAVEAHRDASDAAHEAIQAIADELGIKLPTSPE